MLVPVVGSLARQYPQMRITVLSRPFARWIFEDLAPNVGFMAADTNGEAKGIRGLNALYRRLQAKHFTAVADMHDVLRTKYLRLRFLMDRYRVEHIDKHRKEKKLLVRKGFKASHQLPTSFDNYADVLRKLGYKVELDFDCLPAPNGTLLRQLQSVIGEKKAFQKWIGIAPFAAHQGKIYPLEKMQLVVERLLQLHPSCRVFLFGGPGEKQILDSWQKKFPRTVNASAMLANLKEEIMLMRQLDVMVSMDSSNMHLAAIAGTTVVSIWGATHPYSGFMAWKQNPNNAIQTSLGCRPCSIYGNKPCHRGDLACMNNIAPETIINKVEEIINT